MKTFKEYCLNETISKPALLKIATDLVKELDAKNTTPDEAYKMIIKLDQDMQDDMLAGIDLYLKKNKHKGLEKLAKSIMSESNN